MALPTCQRHVALRFVRISRKLPAQNRILPLSAGVGGADACGAMRPAGATEQGGTMVSSDAANEPAIVAEGVSKLFLEGTVVAFHQLSLAVKRDEIMCVVGPSGCGKTTLLRSIAGLTDVSSGKLLVHGKPVAGRPPDGVAMVFQHFGLLPWKTVYDNAAFGLAMAGASHAQIRERVAHYLELVGLTGFERHYPYQLSGGMQQRVGLVRALAMNPSILLMDEPFAALDAQTREILQEELLALMERPDERKTMVFITHSIDEAILLGDRIAVMSARPGRISAEFHIDAPEPRTEEFRTSADYAGSCRKVSAALTPAYEGQGA